MSAEIIQGKEVALQIRQEIARGVEDLKHRTGVVPGLAAVLVGEDPASQVYVRNKGKACQEAGIFTETFHLTKDASASQLLGLVQELNEDERFHGILVQTPLPSHINEAEVMRALDPAKDVDGLHPFNQGLLAMGAPQFVPATPQGIVELLVRTGHNPFGQHVVVCGRSILVGRPIAMLMLQKGQSANATVTVCHTGTRNMAAITRQADILIVAMGQREAITEEMVKDGVVVVDVGINRVDDSTRKQGYRLVGDVDFEGVIAKASAITPVPGGVGPMTVAMLVSNTLKAANLTHSQ